MVVVEGAGGLLVRLDSDGGTLLDLAVELLGAGCGPGSSWSAPAWAR